MRGKFTMSKIWVRGINCRGYERQMTMQSSILTTDPTIPCVLREMTDFVWAPKSQYPMLPKTTMRATTADIDLAKTTSKSAGFSIELSMSRTVGIPSRAKTAIPRKMGKLDSRSS